MVLREGIGASVRLMRDELAVDFDQSLHRYYSSGKTGSPRFDGHKHWTSVPKVEHVWGTRARAFTHQQIPNFVQRTLV
jgi:hypothetical protein